MLRYLPKRGTPRFAARGPHRLGSPVRPARRRGQRSNETYRTARELRRAVRMRLPPHGGRYAPIQPVPAVPVLFRCGRFTSGGGAALRGVEKAMHDLHAAIADLTTVERRSLIIVMAESRDRWVGYSSRLAQFFAVLAAMVAEVDDRQRRIIAEMERDVSGAISCDLPG